MMPFPKRSRRFALCLAGFLCAAAALAALRYFAPKEYRWVRAWGEFAWVEAEDRLAVRYPANPVPPPFFSGNVAHAGGGFEGRTYTNSREALEFNYQRGFRLFEVDLEWTSDGHIVLVHDWREEMATVPGAGGAGGMPASHSDFLARKSGSGPTRLDLAGLADWVESHPDAFVITDVKSRNLEALRLIWKNHPGIRKRVVPQIYRFREYAPARAIGFGAIILALYESGYPDGPVEAFVRRHPLSGVNMPAERGASPLAANLSGFGIPVYAHTVNDAETARLLRNNGVSAVYTDFLPP